jgi:Uncharacterized protein conserved in bacteria
MRRLFADFDLIWTYQMTTRIFNQKEVDDCREIYLEQNGRGQARIAERMKAKGWKTFSRNLLSTRRLKIGPVPGWPELYGWDAELENAAPTSSRRRKRGRNGFEFWLNDRFPDWNWSWKFQRHLYKKLNAVTTGKCRRLMIFLPPRHGKSELVTVRYAAWRLLTDPKMNLILGSYNQKLASRFSRKILRIVNLTQSRRDAETQREDKTTDKDGIKSEKKTEKRSQSVAEWETAGGGGVRAVGVGGGITGFGANLVIIDDPIKSRAEAESETFRENVWDWFNDDLYTRLEPDASIILIQTRWHEDDLAGRLLREMKDGGEEWEVVSLPALAEATERNLATDEHGKSRIGDEEEFLAADEHGKTRIGNKSGEEITTERNLATNEHEKTRKNKNIKNPKSGIRDPKSADLLGRREGEALCPQRYDRKALLRIKAKLGSYGFSALYQQNPIPAGGGAFKREWFRQIIDEEPKGLKWARGYDLAVSTRTSADYTASFRCAFDRIGNLYIADGFRKRIEYPEQRRYVVEG